ncbi:MAG: glycosyltransferase family 4 protein [Rhodothermaceae bacterium]|nr:glycosyltransferase family 4 protein [Rhodothermaceae bacterium]MYC05184.1 glycosyltransferase family 4 protein [Rhodothermaceae bacterium]MYI17973.1 glycosyltransferase family 4 protein [Rhodothermaceae bacterium]
MRNVLVVAYYFPPLGLSGVQRVVRLIRHLPEYGWQPTVITAKPRGYFAYDESLLSLVEDAGIRVIRTKSLDPTRLFRSGATVQAPRETRRQALSYISNWIFIPDNKLGWMPFALRAGLHQATVQCFDAVFSSAPPYTGHLIGRKLSQTLKLPLITDFRDDWVGNPRHIYPTALHRRLHIQQERQVLIQSSAITTVNRPILDAIEKRHRGINRRGEVIPHGFDRYKDSARISARDKLTLLYTGIFYDTQKPDYFLRGISGFLAENPAMRPKISAIFAGLVPNGFADLVQTLKLEDVVQYVGYLQHSRVVELQQKADVLWMTIGSRPRASRILTGKLSEYMGTRKPILALVPSGAARETLIRYGAAYIVDPESEADVIQALHQITNDWNKGNLPSPDKSFVSTFSANRLTETLVGVLDSVIKTP